ncbi:protein O-linked-mannose beta-1,2-N-acetylglucosaminyltransferase 1-like [Gigantopelta aegis]|uniref:protein O-linked-mannose beta-1,2-N-acetylglucosaminyltransferase 1-like n=1 Tax=Gigantopelta aegis TaxID=1735272 RepID=UPI001B88C2D5|nr:protein O-linked-mannose beta-1,2-N-acetylglucosaminyltransferase 1-like [Gigantopelta aegis]
MEGWVPNPRATPFIPKRRYGMKINGSTFFTKRRCISKFLQGGLVLVLLVTVVINITFILDTNKKLKRTSQPRETDSPDRLPRSISVEVVSSKEIVFAAVDGTTILQDEGFERNRGIHVLVLNQRTGSVMAKQVFDTYSQREDDALVLFINMVSNGRILVFTIKDEGTFQLKRPARKYLKELGSSEAESLNWRDTWAFVAIKGGKAISEGHGKSPKLSSWGDSVSLKVDIPLSFTPDVKCDWPDDRVNRRRFAFCSKVEGYGSVCSCDDPTPIEFKTDPLPTDVISNIPVAVIASDRPHYLYRMLRQLLTTAGANPKMVTVFIDGYFEEPLEVTKLFGLRGIQHTPLGMKNARISQHYKASLAATFNLNPTAQYAIVIEEDLDVSPDFFNYFSQTKYLLDEDSSIYCISAWNDQGYEHSCENETLLYRVETMPGLGWMLTRRLYKEELEPQWPSPEKQWDWDMWMRSNFIRKSRECIIPDISRTYHFGSKGLNMNPYFQEVYFQKHSFVRSSSVHLKHVDSMKKDKYEIVVTDLIKSAQVLNHSISPCNDTFIPDTKDKVYIMYISMKSPTDYSTWKAIAKCYHLWDLDVRGLHKSMWRLFLKHNHMLIVGCPASPYSEFKPADITPIYLNSTIGPLR